MKRIITLAAFFTIYGLSTGYAHTLTEVAGCNCFHIYRPVCGDDGHTYGNHCEARCQGITSVTRGKCPVEGEGNLEDSAGAAGAAFFNSRPKECACPFNFNPVCGLDQRTYPNECAATCRGIAIEHVGGCHQAQLNRGRQCRCPPISRRVCGEDRITYENACFARCKNIAIASNVACPGSGPEPVQGQTCDCQPNRRPVCGADGTTYPNICEALCKGVGIVHNGGCEDGDRSCICTAEFAPVCAENGKTYTNPCRARCNGHTFTEGRCTE